MRAHPLLSLILLGCNVALPLAGAEAAPPSTAAAAQAQDTDLPPSQVSAESLTLDDGTVVTGVYDQATQRLTLINAATGKSYGSMGLGEHRIVARKDITIAVTAAAPKTPNGADGHWSQSLPDALAAAKSSGRPLLMAFTGSDWCAFCKQLQAEVFSQPAFVEWARAHVVLLAVDFPRATPQSPQLVRQNDQLATAFAVNSYPTVLMVASDGKTVLATTGYLAGGPQAWIADLNSRHHLP
jgi:thioredoxin-related protein